MQGDRKTKSDRLTLYLYDPVSPPSATLMPAGNIHASP